MDIVLSMNAVAGIIQAGHRLRLALSCGNWPLLWPAPQIAHLDIDCAASALILPLRGIGEEDSVLEDFAGAEIPGLADISWLRPFSRSRHFVTDVESDTTTLVLEKDDGAYRIASHGMVVEQSGTERQSIREGEPLTSRGESHWTIGLSREAWRTSLEAVTTIACDAESFLVEARVTASEGSENRLLKELEAHDSAGLHLTQASSSQTSSQYISRRSRGGGP